MTCLDCVDRLDHCHGTLLEVAGEFWCTDPTCGDVDPGRHALTLPSTEVVVAIAA